MISGNIRFCCLLLLLAVCGLAAAAQNKSDYKQDKSDYKKKEFCSDNNWSNGDKVAFHELREATIPANSLLNVDGNRNGGVSVKGENRSDVLVRSCVQTWGTSDEAARAMAKNIRIETGSSIHAEGATDENWSVSYQILVPRATNLKLMTHNGGISISSVEGTINFEALNGGVHLDEIAGNVKGRTTNGGLHIALSGNSWKGGGLDVETTNGGVSLEMPSNYAAHFEARTTNGGFKSDISSLNVERKDKDDDKYYRARGTNISTDLNGGGAPIRVVTTNGGVKISSSN